jgi:hypothetical protein
MINKYTGVTWNKPNKMWHSQIKINGKQFHLGYFQNEASASLHYLNAWAFLETHGDKATIKRIESRTLANHVDWSRDD